MGVSQCFRLLRWWGFYNQCKVDKKLVIVFATNVSSRIQASYTLLLIPIATILLIYTLSTCVARHWRKGFPNVELVSLLHKVSIMYISVFYSSSSTWWSTFSTCSSFAKYWPLHVGLVPNAFPKAKDVGTKAYVSFSKFTLRQSDIPVEQGASPCLISHLFPFFLEVAHWIAHFYPFGTSLVLCPGLLSFATEPFLVFVPYHHPYQFIW